MTTLYRAFDAEDRLLYVGVSGNVFIRLTEHEANAAWTAYAVRIQLERYATREEALTAEAEAILTEDPVWNMDGRPFGRFMQWMAAYPRKNPDDFDVNELRKLGRDRLFATTPNQGEDPTT